MGVHLCIRSITDTVRLWKLANKQQNSDSNAYPIMRSTSHKCTDYHSNDFDCSTWAVEPMLS